MLLHQLRFVRHYDVRCQLEGAGRSSLYFTIGPKPDEIPHARLQLTV